MSEAERRHLAEAVRQACLAAAASGFEQAALDGLCYEGAVEAAASAIQRLDLIGLIRELPAASPQ
ncbi:MAG: acetyltransferase [Chloroflexi bacterium]|nr:acetyltransferase [Chloroflexota bacterium]MCI0579006.1 acetyltransferase [Chloroflexota bacterium]MCI0644793.1 acetyltransferase [Chloroflexota bacterium]MCI0731968.1 acetyltransferase [Chloroflexota bacterium]